MSTTRPSYPELQRCSPSRSPAWRWERASGLVRAGRHFSRRRDDEPTRLAVAYLRGLRRCRRESHRHKLANTYPDVQAARQLHEQGGDAAVEVQARLLARQPFDEVARRTAVSVDVVQMYEALFFNITDRLHARDWIIIEAIGWWTFNPATGRDPATVLRAYGYHGGPLLFDAALPYLLGDRLTVPSGLDPLSPQGRLDRSLRLAVLLETAPWGAKTDAKLLKLHAQVLENARQVALAAKKEGVIARNASEVLDNLAADVLQRCPAQGQSAGDHGENLAVRETA